MPKVQIVKAKDKDTEALIVNRCSKCPALCCTVAGEVDITPTEADIISTVTGKPTKDFVMPVENGRLIIRKGTGLACPFLSSQYNCSIYDYRPETCRKYTCKGDPVIYQLWRMHRYVRY